METAKATTGETEMKTYKFGTYSETVDGKNFDMIASVKCDSDAQAELVARHKMEDGNLNGIYIQRGNVEWFIY